MNRKQLVILLVLVVIVGTAGLMLRKKQSASWEGPNPALGKKLLGDLPINDVTHIAVKQGTNEVNLAKKEDLWRVRERNDYPANYSEISDFLLKIHDLKIIQSEPVGASQLPRLELAPGAGTNSALVVEFKDQSDKTLKSLLLGKKHTHKYNGPSPMGGEMGEGGGYPDGRYVKLGTGSDTVAVISDPLANVVAKPDKWLNKDFFKIEKPKSIAVTPANPTNAWKLTRETETGDWKLADAKPTEQLDTAKITQISSPFSSPSFEDVLISPKSDEASLEKPAVLTVDTFDNFTYTIKVGQKTNENFPIALSVAAQLPKDRLPGKDEKPEDKDKLDKEFKEKQKKLEEKLAQEKTYEKWVYLVANWTVDPFLKDRAQLLVEKKEEPKKDEAKKEEKSAALDGILPTEIAKPNEKSP